MSKSQDSMTGSRQQVISVLFGQLKLSGCEKHPLRLDLSCCKIRQTDGAALTTKQVWEVIIELATVKPSIHENTKAFVRRHYNPIEDAKECDGAQMWNDQWWMPKWGCDTLGNMLDDMDYTAERRETRSIMSLPNDKAIPRLPASEAVNGYAAVELEEIKSALATVLPGPWRYDHDGVVWASEAVKPTPDSNALSRVCDATGRWAMHDPTHEAQILANLRFIAKCREWIPSLVAEVEQLRRQNDPKLSDPAG